MKTGDLKKLPMQSLLELQRRVTAAVKTKQAQMKRARARVVALANKLGITTRELAGIASRCGPDKAPRKARAKHVNPKDSTQTWSGKGRPPAWFKSMNGTGSSATH